VPPQAAETVGFADITSADRSRRLPLMWRDGTSVACSASPI